MNDRLDEARAALPTMLVGDRVLDAEAAEAIESVGAHAGPVWREQALRVVQEYACRHDTFTVEAISELVPPAIDGRALGWVMREAARRGWIENAGYVKAGRARHNKPTVQWCSKLRGAAP